MYGAKNLIGRKIVEVRGDKYSIGFVMDDGAGGQLYQQYDACGDCCSNTWIEHVSGVPLVIGGIVQSVEDKGMGAHDDPVHDYLRTYRTSIITDKGQLDIEYRNASNGYYGGSLEHGTDDILKQGALPVLTSDF